MNSALLSSINLKDRTLAFLGRRQYRGPSKGTLWPSEASAAFVNQYGEREVVGKCHRATYYRVTGVEETNPPTAQNQVLFMLGNSVEEFVTEAWKQMGIWENNSVKFQNSEKNISGEFDVICREGDDLYGVEVKSFYGYYANKKILGHWSGRGANKRFIPGNPKDEHLMQAALYCDVTRGRLAGFKLFYCSRDGNDMGEFNITVSEEGVIYVDGIPNERYNINDVYARYELMNGYKDNEEKPEREFTYLLSNERVDQLHARGDISASAYKEHCSGRKPATDWHCSYCNFRDHCLSDNDEVETVMSEIETMPDAMVHGSL